MTPERFGAVTRSHWGIENRLHWRLDVSMNEDQARNGLGYGPENLTVLPHMALNLLRKEPSKGLCQRSPAGPLSARPSWSGLWLCSEM